MPYKDENDPKLPDRIKRLPDTRRRQWVNVWNNVYDRCSDRGGETTTCEAMAFRQANGVIAKVAASKANPLLYKSDGHTGAMIALFLPADIGRQFTLSGEGALPPAEFHITLAYLGEAAELSPAQVDEVHEILGIISENHPPLRGGINGCGRFCNGGEEGDPFFIIPDLPQLPNLREAVIGFLRNRNIGPTPNHGYVPHITLAYIPHAAPNPFNALERIDNILFPSISLVLGGERFDYSFTQGDKPMEKTEVVIDGIGVSLRGLLESLKLPSIQKAISTKKYELEIEATDLVFERFKRFLAMLAYNTSIGHSANFGMFADGDGADYLKVNGLDLEEYKNELKDFQAKYNSIEMAGEDRYYSLPLEKRGVSKMITIDGIGIDLQNLLESLKLQGTRDKLKEDQAARAKKYGIKVQAGAPLTMPARFARMGAKLDDLADRVNYRYPVWLTRPDRESLTPAQLAQVLNAPARFAQFATRYDQMSRAQVERRIDEARKKFGVGQPAKEGELEKSWDCLIFKRNEEKRIALSVALKASGGDNGIRPDSQRDILTAEEVEAAAYNFMLNSRQFDLHHKSVLPTSRAAVVESYLAPVDFTAGKTEVRKGDWIVGVHFADPVLWEKVKAGEINAFSIKGVGKRRPFQG